MSFDGVRSRSRVVAVLLALALVIGACGGSDGDGDGDDGGNQAPETTVESTDGGDESTGDNCRMETVEDEYGFEVEIEVCDDE
ncbi:MAG: hypothetical protein ACR2QE_06825 [Acidimicrobiales bacterium]